MRGASESPIPAARARGVPAAALLPIDEPATACRPRCAWPAATRSSRCRRRRASARQMRRVGTLAFTLKGQQLTLTAFVEADETDAAPPVRAVRRPHERHRNLSGRPLSRSRSHRTGIYDLDFNRAYHPVLRLQPDVRVSRAAAREPSEGTRSAPASGCADGRHPRHRLRLRRRARQLRAAAPARRTRRCSRARHRARRATEYYAHYLGFDDVRCSGRSASGRLGAGARRRSPSLIDARAVVFDEIVASTASRRPLSGGRALRPAARRATCPLGIASGALRHEIETILRARRSRSTTSASSSRPGTRREQAGAGSLPCAPRELHGVPPSECVAIEDSRWGIESAKAAGLRCVGITHDLSGRRASGADAVIDSLDEFTVDRRFSQPGTLIPAWHRRSGT